MRFSRIAAATVVVAAAFALAACSSSDGDVIAPVTEEVGDLQGRTIDLVVDQVLNINTGDLAVDSYDGTVADPAVAEFVAGGEEGDATFNPGVKALAVGETDVVLSNTDGGIQDVTFTVRVTE
jgi:hypothetical protein